MNPAYDTIISASNADRGALFAEAAVRMGTAIQNVEKDFWVCWTLDALFNGLDKASPRLLFKGGTSLSKAFNLVPRFSEDIDITIFREDIGQAVEAKDLETLSGKQLRKRLDAIRDACRTFIAGPLAAQLNHRAADATQGAMELELDPDDPDGQTLLLWYPTATARGNDYIRSAVKIEGGARSALDPHESTSVTPYIAKDLPHLDLQISNVVTVAAQRTFWDKVIILHGLHQWYAKRGVLRHRGQRVSRHYFDLHQMMRAPAAAGWLANHELAQDCATHARLFFGSPDLGLQHASRGSFTLLPSAAMRDALRADYEAMSGMIFGTVPSLDDVLATIDQLEAIINKAH